jgi:hypothetical protein
LWIPSLLLTLWGEIQSQKGGGVAQSRILNIRGLTPRARQVQLLSNTDSHGHLCGKIKDLLHFLPMVFSATFCSVWSIIFAEHLQDFANKSLGAFAALDHFSQGLL